METFKYYTNKTDKGLLGTIIRNSYTYTMRPYKGATVFTITTYWENYTMLISYLVIRKKEA